ncbi:MAG: response regulator transcription factor [Treponema sp.]|nr:response regulator transcription factor [Treponema sp.]
MKKISITIASKQGDDRNIMAALLAGQDDFTVSSIAGDDFDIVRSAMTLQPNVIVMDFYLEDHDTLRLVPVIKRNSPTTALIVLCHPKEHIVVDQVLKAGISGYLLKQDIDDLASAIRCVFYGGLYVSKAVKTQAFDYFSTDGTMKGIEKAPFCDTEYRLFTPTELQIFQGIIHGHSDGEIAENLNMSIGAIRNCIYHAKKKVGMRNRTQISLYALSRGMIAWENDFTKAKDVKNCS